MAGTVSIAILADSRKAVTGFDNAGQAAEKAGSKFDGVAAASDGVASASSQAAGGIGDLGGALSLMPGPLGAVGSGMEALSPAIMGVTGAADLLNLTTEKFPKVAKVATAASKVMATAQRVLGAAIRFAMGPWGLALAAITVAIVLLWKKNEGFRNAVIKVWNKIKAGVGRVLGWFKGGFLPFFKALPGRIVGFIRSLPGRYVAIYRKAFTLAFTLAKNLGGKLFDVVKAIPGKLIGLGGRFLTAGKSMMTKLFKGLKAIGDLGTAVGKAIINAIIGAINNGIQKINDMIPNYIDLPGPKNWDLDNNPIPKIPTMLANGGILNGPTFVAGEAGREVVAPLDELYRELGGRSNVYSITINAGPTTDRVALGRELVALIDSYERAGGRRRA